MKTLYLVNTGYKPQPKVKLDVWVKHTDFMDAFSAWHIAPKAQAMQAIDSYEVLCVRYEQLQGYCMATSSHAIVYCSAANEFDRVSIAMQREQDKYNAKLAMYNSLLKHLSSL